MGASIAFLCTSKYNRFDLEFLVVSLFCRRLEFGFLLGVCENVNELLTSDHSHQETHHFSIYYSSSMTYHIAST